MQPQQKPKRKSLFLLFLIQAFMAACLAVFLTVYTFGVLGMARSQGTYATPQEGVAVRARTYLPDYPNLVIDRAGPNAHDGSSPHIWYVIWRVCKTTTDLNLASTNCTGGGNFFLHAREGWVYMSEDFFPTLVGAWMKILGLAAS